MSVESRKSGDGGGSTSGAKVGWESEIAEMPEPRRVSISVGDAVVCITYLYLLHARDIVSRKRSINDEVIVGLAQRLLDAVEAGQ